MPQKCSSLKNCVKLKMSTCCSRHFFDFSPIDDCAVELSALHLSELKPCVTSILKQRFTPNDVFRLNMNDIFSFMVIDSPFLTPQPNHEKLSFRNFLKYSRWPGNNFVCLKHSCCRHANFNVRMWWTVWVFFCMFECYLESIV